MCTRRSVRRARAVALFVLLGFASAIPAIGAAEEGGLAIQANAGSPPVSAVKAPDVPDKLATEYPLAEPVLRARFRDQGRSIGQVLYTIIDPEGHVVVEDAPGTVVVSGRESSFAVPAGTLADGVLYRWQARSFNGISYSLHTSEPAFVATSLDGSALGFSASGESGDVGITAYGNPWGCYLAADNPHFSLHTNRIAAQARTVCLTAPPTTYVQHTQYLYRSSWSGWRYVGYNSSVCDAGTALSGQSEPDCYPWGRNPRMKSWVSWDCIGAGFLGGYYHYRQVAGGQMLAQGTWYVDSASRETGPYWQTGTVRCGI